jgi:hypothetical protein
VLGSAQKQLGVALLPEVEGQVRLLRHPNVLAVVPINYRG